MSKDLTANGLRTKCNVQKIQGQLLDIEFRTTNEKLPAQSEAFVSELFSVLKTERALLPSWDSD
jgi:hypothetical protein